MVCLRTFPAMTAVNHAVERFTCEANNTRLSTNLILEGSTSSTYNPTTFSSTRMDFYLGYKKYELSNHLGNVLAVISDRKLMVDDGTYLNGYKSSTTLDNISDFYIVEYHSFGMYYAFGAPLPGRGYVLPNSEKYRYGFNGMEKTKEIYGDDNAYTTEYRQLDVRLGRWFSGDLIVKPWESPYALNHNCPLLLIDPSGLDPEKRWSGLRRLFTAKYKCEANKYASENNIDEKNVDYNRVNEQTGQKYASIKKVKSSGEEVVGINGGSGELEYWMKTTTIINKKFYDGGSKERHLNILERMDLKFKKLVGSPGGEEKYSFEWMKPGDSDPTNQERGPGGPDAAGIGFGADYVCGAGGGGDFSFIESNDGINSYETLRGASGVMNMGAKVSYGPSIQFYWLTDLAKSSGYTASSQLTGESVYYSAGYIVGGTLIHVNDAEGNLLMWGISVQGTTGFATGSQVTEDWWTRLKRK